MTERTQLQRIKDITESKKNLEKEIKKEIENIFKKAECQDALFKVEFYESGLWIYLDEGCLIPTDLFPKLNKYLGIKGDLSYSDVDDFVINFKW